MTGDLVSADGHLLFLRGSRTGHAGSPRGFLSTGGVVGAFSLGEYEMYVNKECGSSSLDGLRTPGLWPFLFIFPMITTLKTYYSSSSLNKYFLTFSN